MGRIAPDRKYENLYFIASAQKNWMKPIFVSYEAPFRSNLQKSTGPVRVSFYNFFTLTDLHMDQIKPFDNYLLLCEKFVTSLMQASIVQILG